MDDFSPHYTTTQEQVLLRERRVSATATDLNVTVADTAIRVDLKNNHRSITMQQSTSKASAATIGQSSATANAVAAPTTTPATPGHVARAAPAAPVLALDRNQWSPHDVALPTQIQPRVNTNQFGFNSPRTAEDGRPIYTGWEPLVACVGHGRNAQHLSLDLSLRDYKRLCRGVPGDRRVDGTLLIQSFGEMFCVRWAEKFSHFPKTDGNPSVSGSSAGNPAELTRKPNFAVHDFVNAVLRHEPSAIPQTMNRYFRQVTLNTDQQVFAVGDISNAVLRWFESCPTASIYFRAHPTGPIRFQADFLEQCNPEIANAFAAVWHDGIRQALDYVRMRYFMVSVRRHPMWTKPADVRKLKKSDIRRIEVDQNKILQHRQIVLTDTWGDKFMTDIRPDVQVRQLSGLAKEALNPAKDLFLGHAVERIYIFWGRDELLYGPGSVSDHLYSLSQHFAKEFPYVQCFLVLPPYVLEKHDIHRRNVQRIIQAQANSFANVTLVWFPTDEQLSDLFEAALLRGNRPVWSTNLQAPDGNPSEGGILLRKTFWELRYDVTLWRSDSHDREKERLDEAASLETIHDLEQQQQPPSPSREPPNAKDDSSVMDYEQSNQGPADTEGNPSVAEIPLPAQKEPVRSRTTTGESSGVEILERDDSPGVLSNFSVSPGPTIDVVPLFQHFIEMNTMQSSVQPQINPRTLAQLYPHASRDILDQLWNDFQQLKQKFYAVQRPETEAVGTANAVPQPKPTEAQYDIVDEDANVPDSTTVGVTQQLQELLYANESHSGSDVSEPEYDPLPRDHELNSDDARELAELDHPLIELGSRIDILAQRAQGQSPEPMDEQDAPSAEARQSEPPTDVTTDAEETTGGTTGRSDSQTSDPWTHDGPTGSGDW